MSLKCWHVNILMVESLTQFRVKSDSESELMQIMKTEREAVLGCARKWKSNELDIFFKSHSTGIDHVICLNDFHLYCFISLWSHFHNLNCVVRLISLRSVLIFPKLLCKETSIFYPFSFWNKIHGNKKLCLRYFIPTEHSLAGQAISMFKTWMVES